MLNIDSILDKCLREEKINDEEVLFLLSQTEKENLQKIYKTARSVREKHFENKVFLYGFVYFSTYCKNECSFCYYRASNNEPPRYRKTVDEIVNTALELKNSGVHLIDLTMGEDNFFINHPERLVDIVKKVKKATDLPVMVSPGVVSHQTIDELCDAGADWYALYQETHNKEIFEKSRLNQDFHERIDSKIYARENSMLTEEGLLTGIGDDKFDALNSFKVMRELCVSQVRVMTFIPQKGTPFSDFETNGFDTELKYIAIMRLLFPDKLIPASLDVDGLRGLKDRLDAGANVVTSIIPPCEGYKGVAHSDFDVDEGYRTVQGISETLNQCNLITATVEDYKDFVLKEKNFKKDR